MGSSDVEVLVVGAGPTGLVLATELVRRGVTCRIVDRAAAFERSIRGKGVQPRTQEVFEDLGILDTILARGERNQPGRSYDDSGRATETYPAMSPDNAPTPDQPYRGIVMLAQYNTEVVLRDHLAASGVSVELGHELIGVDQDAGHVHATVRCPGGQAERVTAQYLAGCDGGHSAVRRSSGIPFLGETWGTERFLLADLDIDGLDPAFGHYWIDPEAGFLAMVPLRHDRNWTFQAALPPVDGGAQPTPSLELCREILRQRTGRTDITLRDPTALGLWRPNIRMVDRFRHGRVFLAGDAAHAHSAAGGQGMNTGVQDAYNLGWKLARVLHGAPDRLLDSYQAERLPVARNLLETSTARHQGWLHTAATSQDDLRDYALGKDRFGDSTQLTVTYRGGPLACDLGAATGVRAGDRAPDAPCVRAGTGAPTRLFEVFQGTHVTQLVFGAPDTAAPVTMPDVRTVAVTRDATGSPNDTLVDVDGHAHRAYGVTGTAIVLVRPDGYILLTAPAPADAATIGTYLTELGMSTSVDVGPNR